MSGKTPETPKRPAPKTEKKGPPANYLQRKNTLRDHIRALHAKGYKKVPTLKKDISVKEIEKTLADIHAGKYGKL